MVSMASPSSPVSEWRPLLFRNPSQRLLSVHWGHWTLGTGGGALERRLHTCTCTIQSWNSTTSHHINVWVKRIKMNDKHSTHPGSGFGITGWETALHPFSTLTQASNRRTICWTETNRSDSEGNPSISNIFSTTIWPSDDWHYTSWSLLTYMNMVQQTASTVASWELPGRPEDIPDLSCSNIRVHNGPLVNLKSKARGAKCSCKNNSFFTPHSTVCFPLLCDLAGNWYQFMM